MRWRRSVLWMGLLMVAWRCCCDGGRWCSEEGGGVMLGMKRADGIGGGKLDFSFSFVPPPFVCVNSLFL